MREYIIKVMSDEPLSSLKAGETIQAVMKTEGDCDELIRCKDCKCSGEQISDGRYWCKKLEAYMTFCSEAERKEE